MFGDVKPKAPKGLGRQKAPLLRRFAFWLW